MGVLNTLKDNTTHVESLSELIEVLNSKIQDDLIVAEVVAKDKSLVVENLQKWCKIKIGKYKTPKKASKMILLSIFEFPLALFKNTMDSSIKLKPLTQALNFISIWNAYPTNLILFIFITSRTSFLYPTKPDVGSLIGIEVMDLT